MSATGAQAQAALAALAGLLGGWERRRVAEVRALLAAGVVDPEAIALAMKPKAGPAAVAYLPGIGGSRIAGPG